MHRLITAALQQLLFAIFEQSGPAPKTTMQKADRKNRSRSEEFIAIKFSLKI
jgi:hypothetical protein